MKHLLYFCLPLLTIALSCCTGVHKTQESLQKAILLSNLDNRNYGGWSIEQRNDYLLVSHRCPDGSSLLTHGVMDINCRKIILTNAVSLKDSIDFFSLTSKITKMKELLGVRVVDYFNPLIVEGEDTVLFARMTFAKGDDLLILFQMDSIIYNQYYKEKTQSICPTWYIPINEQDDHSVR